MTNFKNFSKVRDGETIGGGYIVLRRGKGSGRVRMSFKPFEHGDEDAAIAQAAKLAKENPGERFDVFQQCHWEQEAPSVPVE